MASRQRHASVNLYLDIGHHELERRLAAEAVELEIAGDGDGGVVRDLAAEDFFGCGEEYSCNGDGDGTRTACATLRHDGEAGVIVLFSDEGNFGDDGVAKGEKWLFVADSKGLHFFDEKCVFDGELVMGDFAVETEGWREATGFGAPEFLCGFVKLALDDVEFFFRYRETCGCGVTTKGDEILCL